ncbi:uncharacterized protein LOC125550422 [Triticum urartu]|uniref:uncharacterized protein LOC125550422 n=1 Tax=Triticum urartu TaxID=4572 RepID=UPI0020444AC4|nr:uncharacterized protein LOC125550422 [Triticum urartu]
MGSILVYIEIYRQNQIHTGNPPASGMRRRSDAREKNTAACCLARMLLPARKGRKFRPTRSILDAVPPGPTPTAGRRRSSGGQRCRRNWYAALRPRPPRRRRPTRAVAAGPYTGGCNGRPSCISDSHSGLLSPTSPPVLLYCYQLGFEGVRAGHLLFPIKRRAHFLTQKMAHNLHPSHLTGKYQGKSLLNCTIPLCRSWYDPPQHKHWS